MSSSKLAGLVCCSNGLDPAFKYSNMPKLKQLLLSIGIQTIEGKHLYRTYNVFSGSGIERANDLMEFFKNENIDYIFDLSGGDIANEVLRYLDFDMIRESNAVFVGYSDLTTIINAIYAKTGKTSILYQVRNILSDYGNLQLLNINESLIKNQNNLFQFPYEWIQGNTMEGTVVGGNIRCFLKLAGTEYFPDLTGKILLLEAMSGTPAQITTYLSQLYYLGAFDKISGLILGTFTQMEREDMKPSVTDLLDHYIDKNLPVAKTFFIGHGTDSMAIRIGSQIYLN